MKFKYTKLPAGGKLPSPKLIAVPLIEVELSIGNYLCLVDSGADHCFFPAEVGERLGLKVKKGRKIEGTGITGTKFTVYFHKIPYKIGGWDYEAEIGFSYDLGIPFGVLGRDGFFEFFVVKITHSKEEIELKDLTR